MTADPVYRSNMIDKSELPYAVITGIYLVALVIANGFYILFWLAVIGIVWVICFIALWLWRFFGE